MFCASYGFAQDIIILKNGSEIEAKVENISSSEISYLRKDSPNGPIYSLNIGDIFMIKYENGTKDLFGDNSSLSYDYPYPIVSKSYAVGDWFDESGIKGIVVYVDESGRHGLVMYPKNHQKDGWKPKETSYSREHHDFGANNPDDGYLNLLAQKQWAENNGKDFNYFFPQASYVEQLGQGWYIPSKNEVILIALAYNGGQLSKANKEARKKFNETLKSHGGKKINWSHRIASSTEYALGEYISILIEDGSFVTPSKVHGPLTTFGYIRPVHKF